MISHLNVTKDREEVGSSSHLAVFPFKFLGQSPRSVELTSRRREGVQLSHDLLGLINIFVHNHCYR